MAGDLFSAPRRRGESCGAGSPAITCSPELVVSWCEFELVGLPLVLDLVGEQHLGEVSLLGVGELADPARRGVVDHEPLAVVADYVVRGQRVAVPERVEACAASISASQASQPRS